MTSVHSYSPPDLPLMQQKSNSKSAQRIVLSHVNLAARCPRTAFMHDGMRRIRPRQPRSSRPQMEQMRPFRAPALDSRIMPRLRKAGADECPRCFVCAAGKLPQRIQPLRVRSIIKKCEKKSRAELASATYARRMRTQRPTRFLKPACVRNETSCPSKKTEQPRPSSSSRPSSAASPNGSVRGRPSNAGSRTATRLPSHKISKTSQKSISCLAQHNQEAN